MQKTILRKNIGYSPRPKPANIIRIGLDGLIHDWKKLCDFEKDAHVAISADEGDGKSTLLSQIVKRCKGNLDTNIVYTSNMKEFYYKYEQIEEGSVIGIDEALDLINRLDWQKAEVKDLVKHIRGKVRKEKRAIFVYNVQLFRDLHSYWRNHRIRWWLELTPREWYDKETNFAYVMQRSRVPFITGKRDAWLLDDNEKSWLGYMSGGKVLAEHYLNMLRGHSFYVGEFRFNNDHELVEKYKAFRLKAIDEWKLEPEPVKINKRIDILKKQRADLFKLAISKFTRDEIANHMNLSKYHVSTLINEIDSQKAPENQDGVT